MSDGKILPEVQFDLFQKINQIEVKQRQQDEAFEKMLKCFEKFDELKTLSLDQECQLQKLRLDLESQKGFFSELFSSISKRIDELFEEKQKLASDTKELKQSSEKDFSSLQEALSKIIDRIQLVESNAAPKFSTSDAIKDIQSCVSFIANQVSDLKKSHESHAESLKIASEKFVQHESVHENFAKILEDYKEFADDRFDRWNSALDEKFSYLNGVLLQEVSSLKSELDAIPASSLKLEDVTSEIDKKHQMITLDASSAVLKAGNVETQVRIMDKKLENIMLLLKKYELAQ